MTVPPVLPETLISAVKVKVAVAPQSILLKLLGFTETMTPATCKGPVVVGDGVTEFVTVGVEKLKAGSVGVGPAVALLELPQAVRNKSRKMITAETAEIAGNVGKYGRFNMSATSKG